MKRHGKSRYMATLTAQPLRSPPENSPVELAFTSVRPRALRESVFEALLSAIVRGEMKPGVWSNHHRLAEHLGISVTPLREALQELAACGIVESPYNRGTIVRPFGPVQLSEIFYVRALLEAEATRLSCPQIDQAALSKLQLQTAELMAGESASWTRDVIASDDRLHTLIADSCGNQRLKEEIFRYRSLLMCIRRAVVDHHYPFTVALPEHLAIIEALLRRDSKQAVDAMTGHILSAAKICSEVLFPEAKAE
jgi:DNA-binding GntR family transcriptional regulator